MNSDKIKVSVHADLEDLLSELIKNFADIEPDVKEWEIIVDSREFIKARDVITEIIMEYLERGRPNEREEF